MNYWKQNCNKNGSALKILEACLLRGLRFGFFLTPFYNIFQCSVCLIIPIIIVNQVRV